jgi:hypothetical protein
VTDATEFAVALMCYLNFLCLSPCESQENLCTLYGAKYFFPSDCEKQMPPSYCEISKLSWLYWSIDPCMISISCLLCSTTQSGSSLIANLKSKWWAPGHHQHKKYTMSKQVPEYFCSAYCAVSSWVKWPISEDTKYTESDAQMTWTTTVYL